MNEPAFPGLHPSRECHYSDAGMSLRDYFAAKAMQGFAASDATWRDDITGMARCAYGWADAMMAVRELK